LNENGTAAAIMRGQALKEAQIGGSIENGGLAIVEAGSPELDSVQDLHALPFSGDGDLGGMGCSARYPVTPMGKVAFRGSLEGKIHTQGNVKVGCARPALGPQNRLGPFLPSNLPQKLSLTNPLAWRTICP
jgi:hypothetical protein